MKDPIIIRRFHTHCNVLGKRVQMTQYKAWSKRGQCMQTYECYTSLEDVIVRKKTSKRTRARQSAKKKLLGTAAALLGFLTLPSEATLYFQDDIRSANWSVLPLDLNPGENIDALFDLEETTSVATYLSMSVNVNGANYWTDIGCADIAQMIWDNNRAGINIRRPSEPSPWHINGVALVKQDSWADFVTTEGDSMLLPVMDDDDGSGIEFEYRDSDLKRLGEYQPGCDCNVVVAPTPVRFTAIPEPGALSLLALGLLALIGRRAR